MLTTSVVWPHGKEELQEFLKHLYNTHPNMKFTMETEQNQSLPFFDVLVSRRPDGSLGHIVYRKPTHTNLCLHTRSKHPPAQKRAVLTTLIQRAQIICYADSLDKGIKHLKIFRKNRHSCQDIIYGGFTTRCLQWLNQDD
jgi:hypothetical protein